MLANTITLLAAANIDRKWVDGIIKDAGVPVPDDDGDAVQLASKLSDLNTQKSVAEFVINVTAGRISSSDLNQVINDEAGGKGSDRVGPHFMSLARSGKLDVRDDIVIPTKGKAAKPFESLEAATKAFDRLLGKVSAEHRTEFVAAARKSLTAAAKAD